LRTATINSYSVLDYYSFGMAMPGRTYNSASYRFGNNGQEKDAEIFDGAYTAEYWELDSRSGRRWEPDPVVDASLSPYATFANNPVAFSDPNGMWPKWLGGKGKQLYKKTTKAKQGLGNNKKGNPEGKDGPKDKGKPEEKEKPKGNGSGDDKGQDKEPNPGNPKPRGNGADLSGKDDNPTIYIYRITTPTQKTYAYDNDMELSDKKLREQVGKEVSRIMNNNQLNTNVNVQVITEENAKKITTQFLIDHKSAILGISPGRMPFTGGAIGASGIGESNGTTDPNPDFTYINVHRAQEHAKQMGVSTDYMIAYLIAHETLHQLYSIAQIAYDPTKEHTNGWPNLNRNGLEVQPNDFKDPMPYPYDDLKNRAEWIPWNIKNVLNQYFKSKPLKQ